MKYDTFKLLQLAVILLISGCNHNKVVHNKNTVSKTLLPVSSNSPRLVEANDGITSNVNYLPNDGGYIVYNFKPNKEGGIPDIRYAKIKKHNPLLFSESKPLKPKNVGKGRYISSIVFINDVTWVYYVESNSINDEVVSFRAKWQNENLVDIEELEINKKLFTRSWQRFKYHQGKVYMVHTGGGMYFSPSENGQVFNDFKKIYKWSAQPRVSALGDSLITAFQSGNQNKGLMKSMVSLSNNAGETWSEARSVTDDHENVHDTYIYQRVDGNVDLYYIHPIGDWRGFSLFRRCLDTDMKMGKPELIIEKEVGSPVAPSVHQLEDGASFVTFVEQKSGYNPYALRIHGDASCD